MKTTYLCQMVPSALLLIPVQSTGAPERCRPQEEGNLVCQISSDLVSAIISPRKTKQKVQTVDCGGNFQCISVASVLVDVNRIKMFSGFDVSFCIEAFPGIHSTIQLSGCQDVLYERRRIRPEIFRFYDLKLLDVGQYVRLSYGKPILSYPSGFNSGILMRRFTADNSRSFTFPIAESEGILLGWEQN